MAETGNSILDVSVISDIQSRLASIEAMLGKTNAVSPLISEVSGFQFTNGSNGHIAAIGNIKIYAATLSYSDYKPGKTTDIKKIVVNGFENASNVWVSATPRTWGTTGTKIHPTAYFNKYSNKEFGFYLSSPANSAWKSTDKTKVEIHILIFALFE